MKQRILFVILPLFVATIAAAQPAQESVDTLTVAKIKNEGLNDSKVMETLSYLSDVYGPRLTGSPEFKEAADWAKKRLEEMGLQNVAIETWKFGRGWSLKDFSAEITEPRVQPLIAYPKAWSPSTKGTLRGYPIYLNARNEAELQNYKGKLKGAMVLISDPRDLKAHFTPDATRLTDEELLRMANADLQRGRGRGGRRDTAAFRLLRERYMMARMKFEFCQQEGAAVVLECSSGDDGTVFVQGATVVQPPNTPMDRRINPYDESEPKVLSQIVVAAEHYNRIIRMLEKGARVKLELKIEAEFYDDQPGMNIVGEIPGSDLKDEVVMIGGHFDSWQGGTGATDNGTGSAVCIEAMRILKALDLKPRRTIRIALWGGEEEGLLGSREYVRTHFGERDTAQGSTFGELKKKPEYDKLYVYFNDDNGTGKVRGVYMQGNEAVRQIFRAWLEPFAQMDASTLTLENTGGTDHLSFDAIGLPGFQFIQDDIDYETRTHHSNMDVFDRVQEGDVKQASIIMAAFAFDAAMRDGSFPHKPLAPMGGRAPF
ncbi:MAG TPA: M20/M25/M40 family metallo-hydrolase [Bacteroidota bacterium]|nr:M20/M25/M40 family metallo-hydrolase [Bacteroidota bacterium]